MSVSRRRKSGSVPGKFRLRIEFRDGKTPAPVMEVARILSRVQSLVYHIGDSLIGSDFRQRGSPPAPVIKRCRLVFDEVKIGSFDAGLKVEDAQTLIDGPSLGESSILLFRDISEKIEEEGDPERFVRESIPDPRHRSRIIGDFAEIWPSSDDEYEVNLRFPSKPIVKMSRERRLVLDGLRCRPSMQEKTSVVGVLATLTVAPKARKEMFIIGPDGRIRCSMSREFAGRAKKLIWKPVRAYGEAEFDSAGDIVQLVEVSRIEPFSQLNLKRVFYDDQELRLKQPVEVEVDYQDEMWVMKNEDLGIYSVSESYDDCLSEFQSDFLFVWREYGNASDRKLSKSARALKSLVRSLSGDE